MPINISTKDNQTQLECFSPKINIPHKTPEIVTKKATWLANNGPEFAIVNTNKVYAVAPIKEIPSMVQLKVVTGSGTGIKLSVKYENTPKMSAAKRFIPHDNLTGPMPSIPRIARVMFSKA